MSKKIPTILVLLFALAKSQKLTFRNVVVLGFNLDTLKFNQTISGKTLKETIPKSGYDTIKITDGVIPVLREGCIADLEYLDELFLVNDQITKIQPGAFQKVDELRVIVIKGNQIEEIKAGVFNNLKVGTLELSDNKISRIDPQAFDNMPELLNVNLVDNRLSFWDKNWFSNTPLLTRASFQHNLITELPEKAFENFKGEKHYLSLPLTINIILSFNKIKKIDKKAFRPLRKIKNLWLDGNEIEEWDQNLLDGIEVDELRLDDNKLTCLSGDFEKIFVANNTHLDGNPWNCSCLKEVESWVKANNRTVSMFYSKMTCDAARIRQKIEDLNDILKKMKVDRLTEV